MSDPHGVTIIEAYKKRVPPFKAYHSVDRLLSGIPRKYLSGLKTVVLTDAESLSRGRKRARTHFRGRRVAIREIAGLYHQKWKGEPAWFEIFVDQTVSS